MGSSATIQFWSSRIQPGTAEQGRRYLGQFLEWLRLNGGQFKDYTPDMLIDYQKNVDNGHRYDLLNLLQSWVAGTKGRAGSKRVKYALVRSFFMHNRAELPTDKTYRIRGDAPKVAGQLEADELRRLVLNVNPCFRAVFLVMFQAGMGQDEFLYWNTYGVKQVREAVRDDVSIIRVELHGRKGDKNERNYYTFIGGDALNALKTYWKQRPKDVETGVFLNQFSEPIGQQGLYLYWRRHIVRLGLSEKGTDISFRSGKGLHELRDTFRTMWGKSPARPEVAEWCMGHNIDKYEYNKSPRDIDFFRSEYVKALPYLNIMSSPTPYHLTGREEVETLKEKVASLEKENQRLTQRLDSMSLAPNENELLNRVFADPEFVRLLREKLKQAAG